MIFGKLFHQENLSVKHVLFLFSLIFVCWSTYRYFPEPPLWLSELILKPVIWLLPTFWLVTQVEKKSLASLGLTSKNLLPAIYWGVGLGIIFALEGLITNILKYRGVNLVNLQYNFGQFLGVLLISWMTAFTEEVVFRGYIFNRLSEIWHREWRAGLVSAGLFALAHLPIGIFVLSYNPLAMVAYLLFVFVFGFGSAFVFARSGNLVSSILLHFFWAWPIILFR
ncbi:hypothetical protein COT66_02260 [Candidatus Shapirobacteria bacterium CG09_land_8_20_14_0_10_49_15]|uniref:CAAX prenyl protease 2/Lysostaphin resistance protein A-like domain-containing protein n=2 Tax=Candidatus Shapironibacteriota TaxID=1752721 RepID=A0A2M8L7L6_9BACT|nr:MAG: hypothetical protein COT66_02260 [Candidatus Shapirobacteria bacterium CG09_land_8_20_14_0_10_49_15]PJE70231.1 MAG: hypothetical protein COU97_00735 [Candidatus Shapirobacteria bacterium CG10_big_fil_rev_8_21_14_0_10_48_15]